MTRCPECGSFEMDYCKDDLTCRNCALVIDDAPIESNPYIPDSKKCSHGNFGFSETVPVNGKYVKHHWLKSTREKNLYKAQKKLGLIASKLMVPIFVEKDAFLVFKTAVEHDLNVGRDNLSMLYASVYASCMMHNIPKTPLEIIAFSGVNRTKMLRAYKSIKKNLHLNVGIVDPIDLVNTVSPISFK